MSIAEQIADILAENPTGLKASEIASQIGCTRKEVNSYLYAHKDMYEQHEGYIWTAKSKQKKNPASLCNQQTLSAKSYSVSIQQRMGNTVVSTLTITPNGNGYHVNSTNNQIICSDCNKFVSIHAMACPFCGCPLHYVADTYYKHYGAEAMRNAQRQRQEHQKAEELKQQQAERKRRHDIAWKCYVNNNKTYRSWKWFEKLCLLEAEVFERAIERAKFLNKNPNACPRITDEQWYELIVSNNLEYNQKLQKWEQDKQEELEREEIKKKAEDATRRINALQAEAVCKKNGLSEHMTRHLSGGWYTANEVQARIDAARYFAKTYPHLMIDAERYMLSSVEDMKKEVDFLLKSFPKP